MEADERNGPLPECVARLLARIIETRSPRLRYTVGPTLERIGVALKHHTPWRLYEAAFARYYKLL